MPYLKEHIRKTWITANAGDQVWIVADHGDVQIVKDAGGVRFPIRTDLLSDAMPDDLPPAPVEAEYIVQRKKGRKTLKKIEQTLFE